VPSKVFISYRRDAAKWQAREIYRSLTQVLPRDHVSLDIDSIPPGADFVEFLEGWVEQCDILLALIEVGWADAIDPKTGRRRLENPKDFVRIEVRKALARGIPVVPVLLDGAQIPDLGQLPDDLQRLIRRNAEFIEHRTVDFDIDRLVKNLRLTTVALGQDRMRAEGRIRVDANIVHGAPQGWFKPGAGKTEWFKDHGHGPELVVVPAGEFSMGSTDYRSDEKPVHKVTIPRPFAVGRFAVTFAEWDACVAEGGCEGYKPVDEGWGCDRRPVIDVSWNDAKLYIKSLNGKMRKTYRLPSEAEREYVTRAVQRHHSGWGSSITPKQANYDGVVTFEQWLTGVRLICE
jgi:hypothetical protein